MNQQWAEVTDIKELRANWYQLKRSLNASTRSSSERRIGWPRGAFDAKVREASNSTGNTCWVYTNRDKKTGDYFLLVGRTPENIEWSHLIDLQFNFPSKVFSRKKGGAFVKDASGRVHLAHRAIVTRGTSRVPKQELFEHVQDVTTVAVSSERKNTQRMFLIGALDDSTLFERMCNAAEKVREAAYSIMAHVTAPVTGVNPKRKGERRDEDVSSKSRDPLDILLRQYQAEFSGTTTRKGVKKKQVRRNHGKVVGALASRLRPHGTLFNPYNMDLICERDGRFDLYEVKTASSSQSVFTAIGQLVFLGAALQHRFNREVRRHLVLPVSLEHEARQRFCKELGLRVVTYQDIGAGKYQFNGLS